MYHTLRPEPEFERRLASQIVLRVQASVSKPPCPESIDRGARACSHLVGPQRARRIGCQRKSKSRLNFKTSRMKARPRDFATFFLSPLAGVPLPFLRIRLTAPPKASPSQSCREHPRPSSGEGAGAGARPPFPLPRP